MIKLRAIFAQSQNSIIGNGLDIPWSVKGEQQIFKAVTQFQWCIVGRKTYDTIRGLPDRKFIVITRDDNYGVNTGDVVVHSREQALAFLREQGVEEAYVVGGSEIYEMFIYDYSYIHRTRILIDVEGDVKAPSILNSNLTVYMKVYSQEYQSNEKFVYEIFQRAM